MSDKTPIDPEQIARAVEHVDTYDLLAHAPSQRSTFTVLIGSIGRSSLKEALDSIASQERIAGDQVIVAFDAFEQHAADLEMRAALVQSYGDGFHAVASIGIADEEKVYPSHRPWNGLVVPKGEPYHWLGVEQINHAMRTVPMTGTHLFTIGDDDIFVPGAYAALRPFCDADPLRPVIYRFVAPPRCLLWDKPRLRPCLISGCCIAAPAVFSESMHTRIETTHDFDWIADIVARARAAGKPPRWLDYVGVVARPDAALDARWLYAPREVDEVPDVD